MELVTIIALVWFALMAITALFVHAAEKGHRRFPSRQFIQHVEEWEKGK